MTVTLKPWMTILIVATIAALIGFSTSQLTAANSAKDASASALPATYWLKKIDRNLDKIEDDTHEMCRTTAKYAFLCN